VAEVASIIAPGDAVVSIGQENRLKVYFRDTTEAWKSLRKDARLDVVVQRPETPSNGLPVAARVEEIQPPKAAGEPAVITALVHNPARGDGLARAFEPGWVAVCNAPGSAAPASTAPASAAPASAAPASAAPVLLVPQQALLNKDDLWLVAVLKPQAAPDTYAIEWRMVKPGHLSGTRAEVLDGLQAGERIALQPAALHAYSLRHGEHATVRLTTS
jgi:hypothetical protein